jgi:hypothetical protein
VSFATEIICRETGPDRDTARLYAENLGASQLLEVIRGM